MRRPPKKLVLVSDFPYKKIKPFLWRRCTKCHYESRKECMWHIPIKYNRKISKCRQSNDLKTTDYNICLHCCPSEQDIKKCIADNLVGKFKVYKRVEE